MSDWKERANRALALLAGDSAEGVERTTCLLNHVLDEANRDDYISKDFFNVQQTAGGLPAEVSFDQFVSIVAGHVREELATKSNFDVDLVGEDEFRLSVLSFDEQIRRHIRFLNGVVHQGAPGEAHLGLWQLILDSRSDPRSIYSCYSAYLVDA